MSVLDSVSTPSIKTTKQPQRNTEEFDWILSMTVIIALLAMTLWVFASLIHYGVRNKMWNKRQTNKFVLNSGKIPVYTCVVVLTCTCLLFFISSLFVLNVGYNENEIKICIIASNVFLTFYLFLFACIGLFLWFRQRTFYANQFLNMNYNRVIKMLSYRSIFVHVGHGLLMWILLIIINVSLTSSPRGCEVQRIRFPALNDIFDIYWKLGACGIIFFYSLLIGLLSYALLSIKSLSTNNVSHINRCTTDDTQSENAMPKTRINIQKFKFLKIKSNF